MLYSYSHNSSSAEDVNRRYFKDMIVVENEMVNEAYALLKYQAVMSIFHERYPDSIPEYQETNQCFH